MQIQCDLLAHFALISTQILKILPGNCKLGGFGMGGRPSAPMASGMRYGLCGGIVPAPFLMTRIPSRREHCSL